MNSYNIINHNSSSDLLRTSELISDIKIGGSLGCSGHALVEFTALTGKD